jgi:hypothetical protein
MDRNEHAEAVGPLRHAMQEDGGGQLYGWLRARYAGFQALLAESSRPDWKRVAAGLARLGVLDGRGNPPKAETVRQTWWKVRRDVAALANHSLSANSHGDDRLQVDRYQSEAPREVRSADLPLSSAGGFDPDDIAADATEPEFRPATPRNWSSNPQRRHEIAAAMPSLDRGQDYAEILRQLTERARARSMPMPDIPTAEDE